MSQFVKLCTEQDQFATVIKFLEAHRLHSATAKSNDEAGAAALAAKLSDFVRQSNWSRLLNDVLALPGLESRLFVEVSEDGALSCFVL